MVDTLRRWNIWNGGRTWTHHCTLLLLMLLPLLPLHLPLLLLQNTQLHQAAMTGHNYGYSQGQATVALAAFTVAAEERCCCCWAATFCCRICSTAISICAFCDRIFWISCKLSASSWTRRLK